MPYTLDGGMMALTLLISSLTIVVVAGLLVWAVRASRSTSDRGSVEAPRAVLQRRYARGDLGTEEYERMPATLAKS